MRIRNFLQPKSLSLALFLGVSILLTPASFIFGQNTIESSVDIPALLDQGDKAYQDSDFENASKIYLKIIKTLENQSEHDAFRLAIKERYSQAAVEQAKRLSKVGAYAQAKELLVSISTNGVENYGPARDLLDNLDDPVRYNPALTKEHAENVIAVAQNLRKAEGAFDLADYDKAEQHYRDALRIDPYNKAARRGLERVAVTKSDYFQAAQDETRARMLAQVDAQWELQVPLEDSFSGSVLEPDVGSLPGGATSILQKARAINIPLVDLEEVNLSEAIEALREFTKQYDTVSLDPSSKGLDFILNLGDGEEANAISNARFDLQLRNIPALQVLEYITQVTKTSYKVETFAIVISPLTSANGGVLASRSWRVPPDFLSRGAVGSAGEGNDDPFAESSNDALPKRLTAKQFLESNGVTFPDGASASFVAQSSQLLVRNTISNLDLVDQVINLVLQDDPVMVKVDVKLLTIDQEELTELGYDWAIGNGRIGDFALEGGSIGNGGAIDEFLTSGLSPITGGNRSGNAAVSNSSIDDLIASENTGAFGSSASRAPGVLALRGVFDQVSFETVLRALNQSKGTDVVSVPSVTTRSGSVAKVEMVREFIYPTEYEPPEVPDTSINVERIIDLNNPGVPLRVLRIAPSTTPGFEGFLEIFLSDGTSVFIIPPQPLVTPSQPTSFETRNTGTTLEVQPIVDPSKKYVDVTINPDFTEFNGFINYGTPISVGGVNSSFVAADNRILLPIFSNSTVNTSVTILDGATLLLGGLQSSQREVVDDKVPVLGSLPIVGRFFSSEVDRTRRQAILIFLTVNLLDPAGRPINP